jgi:hypothetical protein
MKGQVLLITVFTLTFALFSIYMLLAPIKDKLLRIKDMENVYQAISNSEKGLEASLLDVFKGINLSLNKSQNTFPDTDCGGLNPSLSEGSCTQTVYTPKGNPWRSDERFKDNTFIFSKEIVVVINGEKRAEIISLLKSISDGFSGKAGRTTLIGPTR